MKVLLDTNVFIAVKNMEADHQHCEKILDAVDDKKIEAVLSTIIVAEVLTGFYQNKEVGEAEHFMTQAKQSYQIFPVDLEVAERAARLRSDKNMKLPDAIIIATAEIANAERLISKDNTLKKKTGIDLLTPEEFATRHLR